MKTQEINHLTTLAGTMVFLGIVFVGLGRLICYSFMGLDSVINYRWN